jgi:hypothetical protein
MAAGGRFGVYIGLDQKAMADAFLVGGEKVLDVPSLQSVYVAPLPNVTFQTITVKSAELGQIWKEELEAIYNSQKSIDQGLTDCQIRADKILAE